MITRVRMWRDAGKAAQHLGALHATRRRHEAGSEATARDQSNEFTCQLGGPGTPPVDWPELSTSSVRVGIACTNTSTTCAPGAHAPRGLDRHLPLHRHHRRPHAADRIGCLGVAVRRRLPPRQRLRHARLRDRRLWDQGRSGSCRRGSGRRRDRSRVRLHPQPPVLRRRRRRRPFRWSPRTSGTGRTSPRSGRSTPAATSRPRRPRRSPSTTTLPRRRPRPPRSSRRRPPRSADDLVDRAVRAGLADHAPLTSRSARRRVCRTTTQPAGLGSGQATVALPDGPGAYAVSVSLSDARRQPRPLPRGALVDHARRIPPTVDPDSHAADTLDAADAGLRLATPDRRQGPPHDHGLRARRPDTRGRVRLTLKAPDRRPRPHDHEARRRSRTAATPPRSGSRHAAGGRRRSRPATAPRRLTRTIRNR